MLTSYVDNSLMSTVKKLEQDPNFRKEVEKDREALQEFLKRFPFGDNPSFIEQLRPDDVYSKGSRESLLYFLEFKLKRVGIIRLPSARPWHEARDKIDLFKTLLKLIVDDSKKMHEKIDDGRWSVLKG